MLPTCIVYHVSCSMYHASCIRCSSLGSRAFCRPPFRRHAQPTVQISILFAERWRLLALLACWQGHSETSLRCQALPALTWTTHGPARSTGVGRNALGIRGPSGSHRPGGRAIGARRKHGAAITSNMRLAVSESSAPIFVLMRTALRRGSHSAKPNLTKSVGKLPVTCLNSP